MANAPLVSVVTPVYNGEEHLAECIDSVLGQTYPNWEYVIVDNVSADRSAEIAEKYSARDRRIRVIRAKEFVDVHSSHNRALRASDPRSRYCKVVDADDWIYPECLERMVSVAEQHPSVGVVGAYRLYADRVDLDGIIPYWQTFVPGRDVVRQAMLGHAWRGWITGSPTSLLLRRNVVVAQSEFYSPRFWHSDTEATFRVLMQHDLGFVHQVLTFTRCRPGSLMNITDRVNSFKPQEGRLLARFGPKVLSHKEYRRRLHRWFAAYAWYLGRQWLKPSRRGDQEFHAFHQREFDYLLEEAGDDYEVRIVLWGLRRLLANRAASSGTVSLAKVGRPVANAAA